MKNKFLKKLFAMMLSAFMVVSASACNGGGDTGGGNTGDTPGGETNPNNPITTVSDAVLYEEGMQYKTTTKGEALPFYSLTYEFLGGENVMPIGGFYGPHASGGSLDGNERKNLLSDEIFQALDEAGINMFVYNKDMWLDEDGGENANKCIDLCEKYGIGYYVQCSWIENQLGGKTTPYPVEKMPLKTTAGIATLQRILNNITKNGTRKCVLGIHAKDEPFPHEIDTLEVLVDVFYNKLDNNYGLDLFGNALGYWANEWNIFGYSDPIAHEAYLQDYMDRVKPAMLSATQYPFNDVNTPDSKITDLLFDEIAIYREYANEYKIPFWRMMQAGGQWNDAAAWIPSVEPYQSEAELLLDVNMALAYGAKAIQYFPLIQPFHFSYQEGGGYDYERSGLIGADGHLTRWYYYAKRANQQVQAADEYLMNSASEGVIVYGDYATKLVVTDSKRENNSVLYGQTSFREMTGFEGDDCIVGCFDYKGGTALYVVNPNRKQKSNTLVKFDDTYRYTVIQRADVADVVGSSIPLTLDAGEGALIVLH